jgi:hypothetical protein
LRVHAAAVARGTSLVALLLLVVVWRGLLPAPVVLIRCPLCLLVCAPLLLLVHGWHSAMRNAGSVMATAVVGGVLRGRGGLRLHQDCSSCRGNSRHSEQQQQRGGEPRGGQRDHFTHAWALSAWAASAGISQTAALTCAGLAACALRHHLVHHNVPVMGHNSMLRSVAAYPGITSHEAASTAAARCCCAHGHHNRLLHHHAAAWRPCASSMSCACCCLGLWVCVGRDQRQVCAGTGRGSTWCCGRRRRLAARIIFIWLLNRVLLLECCLRRKARCRLLNLPLLGLTDASGWRRHRAKLACARCTAVGVWLLVLPCSRGCAVQCRLLCHLPLLLLRLRLRLRLQRCRARTCSTCRGAVPDRRHAQRLQRLVQVSELGRLWWCGCGSG